MLSKIYKITPLGLSQHIAKWLNNQTLLNKCNKATKAIAKYKFGTFIHTFRRNLCFNS